MDHREQEQEQEQPQRGSAPTPGVVSLARAPWRAIVVGLVVLVLLPVLLARVCTFSPIGFSPNGAHLIPPERLDHAPAASLRVYLDFDGALVPGPTTTVTGWVTTIQGVGVVLTGGQTLTLNGASLIHDQRNTPVTLPRQGSGGPGYTLIYTDEQGQQTIVHIPAPQADFAVLAPAPGSRVPLPRPEGPGGSGAPSGGQHNATPTPTPNPADPFYPPRAAKLADAPFTVRYGLPYPAQSVLQGQAPTADPQECPNNDCTRKNQYRVQVSVSGQPCVDLCENRCGFGIQDQAPTGSATFDDRTRRMGTGFETCGPGPAEIDLSTSIVWNLPSTAFWNVQLKFGAFVKAPFTWV